MMLNLNELGAQVERQTEIEGVDIVILINLSLKHNLEAVPNLKAVQTQIFVMHGVERYLPKRKYSH